jgi:multidrug resistance efflux pump
VIAEREFHRVRPAATAGFPVLVLAALGWWCLHDRHYILTDDAYIAFR